MAAAGVPGIPRPSIAPPRRGRERFLVVRLAGKEFALEASRILATMQMRTLELRPFDGPPGWNVQVELEGRRLPIYCPNLAAGVAVRPVGPRTCLLLIGAPETPDKPGCGLQVDSVSRYEELLPMRVRGNALEGRFVRLGCKWRPVLNLNAIAGYWANLAGMDLKPTTS